MLRGRHKDMNQLPIARALWVELRRQFGKRVVFEALVFKGLQSHKDGFLEAEDDVRG